MMLFEYPLHERTRLFLRLENAFNRLHSLIDLATPPAHQAAMQVLLELLEIVAGRSDIKSELSQELDRQRANLQQYVNVAGVNTSVLRGVLGNLDQAYAGLVGWQQRPGQHLRDNEWLSAIKSRSTIPGGMCEFDLPNYHAWLQQPDAQRQEQFTTWLAPLAPLELGLALTLKLLRQGSEPADAQVLRGQLQIDVRTKPYQLIRVWVSPEHNAVPEFSANKFAVWIRMMEKSTELKANSIERDVPVQLALCSL